MPTDTPQQSSARLAELAVTFQIVVDHPGRFPSEAVAGAKRVLTDRDRP